MNEERQVGPYNQQGFPEKDNFTYRPLSTTVSLLASLYLRLLMYISLYSLVYHSQTLILSYESGSALSQCPDHQKSRKNPLAVLLLTALGGYHLSFFFRV